MKLRGQSRHEGPARYKQGTLVLAQKQIYYPITKAIYELFQLLGDGKLIASALGVWAMVFLGIALTGLTLLIGKKLGALFRV